MCEEGLNIELRWKMLQNFVPPSPAITQGGGGTFNDPKEFYRSGMVGGASKSLS